MRHCTRSREPVPFVGEIVAIVAPCGVRVNEGNPVLVLEPGPFTLGCCWMVALKVEQVSDVSGC